MSETNARGEATPHRKALVTGASAGIGLAFSERLARQGSDLVLVARSRERLEAHAKRLREEHGVGVDVLAADLSQPAELEQVERRVAEDESLDLLVNNAGFGTQGSFSELEIAREEEQIRLNVLALVRLTRAALPQMTRRGSGAIVNVSSLAGFYPGPFVATYGATKAYVTSFTEALAGELRGTGVRVQVLCPGFTRTEFQQRAGVDASQIPSFAWMSAEAVVDASLAGLARGDVVVIPGGLYKALHASTSWVPRGLVRRVMALAGRRLEG
jgi:short-subunit dehydrogenase